LSWINQADLADIAFIKLMDKMPEPSNDSPEWHQRATAEEFSVNGLYLAQQGDTPAHILLFIRDMYRGIPRLYWWTPVPTLRVGRTLAHEVGHHLIAQRGYIFQPGEKVDQDEYEEEMANRYAFSVIKKMSQRWYYRLGQRLAKDLASTYYALGILDWNEKKYKEAAESWYRAWNLDPDHQEAVDLYWRAKKLSKT